MPNSNRCQYATGGAVVTSVIDLTGFIWNHPANRGRRVRAVGRAVAWQIYKRTTGQPWNLQLPHGLQLRCYPDSASGSLMLYCNDRPEFHEMSFLEHYLRPGDGFLDVGANIGAYTVMAAGIVGSEGHIDAFEPGGTALGRLRENVALNHLGQVRVHAVAVGAAPEIVKFLKDQDVVNRIQTAGDAEWPADEVMCVRLDDYVADRGYALGKMDIEGAEILALRGAEAMLARGNPPVWLLELNRNLHAYDCTEEEFCAWLRARDYDVGVYDADRRRIEIRDRPWEGRHNVLAVSRRHLEAVRARVAAE